MKRFIYIATVTLFGTMLLTIPVRAQSGVNPDVRRSVIAGGGGTSAGSGNLQISGTVGQPAAGTLSSGGSFTVVGGFWPGIDSIAAPTPTPQPGSGAFGFSASTYNIAEGCTEALITINRTNGSTGVVTVDFVTNNGTGFSVCSTTNGSAAQSCDFAYGTGTLTFANAEMSKTFSVLISKDAYIEGNETINLALSNPTGGGTLAAQSAATLTIIDNSAVPVNSQPIDDAATFVGQTYHDFLARQADHNGLDYWVGQITQCGSNQPCINSRRVGVSNAFFFELEYQQTGSYVFRLYRAAFGNDQPFPNPDRANDAERKKIPSYAVFLADRARVVGGSSLAQAQIDLANLFVQRAAFVARYPLSLDGPQFVDAVLANLQSTGGVNLTTQRDALVAQYNAGGRGAVIYRLADDNAQGNPIDNRAFIDEEYNRAFVTTQYFGYLRRNADIAGLLFWLNQVNSAPLRDTTRQHSLVCSFITSSEYQQRFSLVVTHSNGECAP